MRNETLTAFVALANELQLSLRNVPNEFLELGSAHFALRVREDIDRIEGVFVTIRKQSGKPRREYGLSYLVEYRGGSPAEVQITAGRNAYAISELVKRYAKDYLSGEAKDFAEFEAFAQKRIDEMFPGIRSFGGANKWVRAEWIDEDDETNK